MEIIQASSRSDLGIMFDEIEGGGLGGAAPWLSRGVWGAARPPNILSEPHI